MSDINYLTTPYEVALEVPVTVLSNDVMAAVTQWFISDVLTSVPAAGGVSAHWELDWFNIPDLSFNAFKAAAPDLVYIKRTIHGLRQFLQIMELQQIKTVARKTVISDAILALHPDAGACCNSYYTMAAPRPPDLGLYDQLVFVLCLVRSRVTYIERRVINAIDMLLAYDAFNEVTDPMQTFLVELDMGILTLADCKTHMRAGYMGQRGLEKCWKFYHKDHGTLTSDQVVRNPMLITDWNPSFTISPLLEMEQIRAAMVHRTLHQSVCCQQPASFQQWLQVSRL